MDIFKEKKSFKDRTRSTSKTGDDWSLCCNNNLEYNPDINEQEFPIFVNKTEKIKKDIIRKYPLLVLVDLRRSRKRRTNELNQLLVDLSVISQRGGDVEIDALWAISDGDRSRIADELNKMRLRDYVYLKNILKKWQSDLNYGENSLFNICGINIDEIRADVEKWVDEMQEIKIIRERLFLNNIKLVITIARKSKYDNMYFYDIKDRIGFGLVGLFRAIDGFSPNLGKEFSSYAGVSIERTIDRMIPSRPEYGSVMVDNTDEQKEFLNDNYKRGDVENSVPSDNMYENGELKLERKQSRKVLWREIADILDKDSDRFKLFKMRYEDGMSQEELRRVFSVSPQAVSSRLERARRKVKQELLNRGYGLDDFWF